MDLSQYTGEPGWALASFRREGEERAGLALGGDVIDLAVVLQRADRLDASDPLVQRWLRRPAALERFLALPQWQALLAFAGEAIVASGTPTEATYPLDRVELLPPVHHPEKIVAVGLNYVTHVDEAEREVPEYPMLFAKYANTLTGYSADVTIPHASHRIDYEGELAVFIGRPAFRVGREEAEDVVAGYAVANDVSARDYQFRTRQILQGKVFDGFCPLGPFLRFVPGESLASRTLRTHVNGEPRQEARLGDMVFDVPYLVEYLSQIMTLRPGDVILTGTPGGIGAAMKPRRWLRPDDVVDIEIDGIGRLSNRFVAAEG